MSRRHRAEKRQVLPDPKFKDIIITKFMNQIMQDGKKSTAERIVYGAFDLVEEKAKKDPVEVFHSALEAISPSVEVRSRRVGGATYQVPVEVRPGRQMALAMRWLVLFARKRPGRSMRDKLANELIEAAHNRGNAVKRRDDVHRMAEANKAFAHYRW